MTDKAIVSATEIVNQLKLSLKLTPVLVDHLKIKLILNISRKEGINATTSELQTAADEMRKSIGLHGVESTQKWMKINHLSIDDLENFLRVNIITSKLAWHLFEDEANRVVSENYSDYFKATFYKIPFDEEDEAWDAFYSIKEGEASFFKTAREKIKVRSEKLKLGLVDSISKKDMEPELAQHIFTTQTSGLLKPVITRKGVFLIYLDRLEEPVFGKEKIGEISMMLLNEKLEKEVCMSNLEIK